MDSLVSTQWLADRLRAQDLRILDATLFLPGDGRDARAEYEAAHVPGAVFLNLEELADATNPLPSMLPSEQIFAERMAALGVDNEQRIIVYDNSPYHSAARAWWMLKSFGARTVAILDGGFSKWRAEERPLQQGEESVAQGGFSARLDPAQLASKDDVAALLGNEGFELLDARSAERFAGEGPEPRAGVTPGHIPGSKNLPQSHLFNSDNSWKRGEALRSAFVEAGIDLGKPMVTTCGSGITAAALLFGAHLLGKQDVKLYDGSWAEWGSDPATPKATGRA